MCFSIYEASKSQYFLWNLNFHMKWLYRLEMFSSLRDLMGWSIVWIICHVDIHWYVKCLTVTLHTTWMTINVAGVTFGPKMMPQLVLLDGMEVSLSFFVYVKNRNINLCATVTLYFLVVLFSSRIFTGSLHRIVKKKLTFNQKSTSNKSKYTFWPPKWIHLDLLVLWPIIKRYCIVVFTPVLNAVSDQTVGLLISMVIRLI